MNLPASCQVRNATILDYDRLRPVFDEVEAYHREALPQLFRAPPDTFPSRPLYTALIKGPESAVFVADEGGELIGFVTVRVQQAPDDPILVPRRFATVDMLAVRSDRRRQGVGRTLMEATHSWARDQGLQEVQLNVWEFNRRAIGFYESLGYRTASRLMEMQVEARLPEVCR